MHPRSPPSRAPSLSPAAALSACCEEVLLAAAMVRIIAITAQTAARTSANNFKSISPKGGNYRHQTLTTGEPSGISMGITVLLLLLFELTMDRFSVPLSHQLASFLLR